MKHKILMFGVLFVMAMYASFVTYLNVSQEGIVVNKIFDDFEGSEVDENVDRGHEHGAIRKSIDEFGDVEVFNEKNCKDNEHNPTPKLVDDYGGIEVDESGDKGYERSTIQKRVEELSNVEIFNENNL